ncbi:hypothetical protein BGZ76_000556 [Entomortierella beljakovae]|nr:hypothetical protein BGZ76_000556 [Entomortierella beljakovae]
MSGHPSVTSLQHENTLLSSSSASLLPTSSPSPSPSQRAPQDGYHDRNGSVQSSPKPSSLRSPHLDSQYIPPPGLISDANPHTPINSNGNSPHSIVNSNGSSPHSIVNSNNVTSARVDYTGINLPATAPIRQPYPVYQDSNSSNFETRDSSEYEVKGDLPKESHNNAAYNNVTVIEGARIGRLDAKQRVGGRSFKIVVVIVVLVIALGVGLGVHFSKKNNDDNNTSNQSSSGGGGGGGGVTNFPTLPPILTTTSRQSPTPAATSASTTTTTTSSITSSPEPSSVAQPVIVPPEPSLPPKGQCSNTTCHEYHDQYVQACSEDGEFKKCANSCANDSCKATCQFSNPCFKAGSTNMGKCMTYCSTPP